MYFPGLKEPLGGYQGNIKLPTLGIFSPQEITCGAPDGHQILVQEVQDFLWIRCATACFRCPQRHVILR